jgi:hypothetical protein
MTSGTSAKDTSRLALHWSPAGRLSQRYRLNSESSRQILAIAIAVRALLESDSSTIGRRTSGSMRPRRLKAYFSAAGIESSERTVVSSVSSIAVRLVA